MSKKKGGLGVNAFMPEQPTPEETSRPAPPPKNKPVSEPRSRATFNLPKRVQNELERVWMEARNMAPDDLRGKVNKSAIVEAALVELIADFDK